MNEKIGRLVSKEKKRTVPEYNHFLPRGGEKNRDTGYKVEQTEEEKRAL